jgi:hypothetical protein
MAGVEVRSHVCAAPHELEQCVQRYLQDGWQLLTPPIYTEHKVTPGLSPVNNDANPYFLVVFTRALETKAAASAEGTKELATSTEPHSGDDIIPPTTRVARERV